MISIGLKYDVDIVFCIDCTESMDNVLNIIKDRALGMYADLVQEMEQKQKQVHTLRVRVIAFRDYAAWDAERKRGYPGHEPMLVTEFFKLPEDAEKLRLSVMSLHPVGGGDAAEDGLEALAYAIRSNWNRKKDTKHRSVIVLWSDAQPHNLGYGKESSRYPNGMAKDIRELTSWWANPACCDQESKRLVLFAPEGGEWSFISDQWDETILYPSKAGDGLSQLDYHTILHCISQSI